MDQIQGPDMDIVARLCQREGLRGWRLGSNFVLVDVEPVDLQLVGQRENIAWFLFGVVWLI